MKLLTLIALIFGLNSYAATLDYGCKVEQQKKVSTGLDQSGERIWEYKTFSYIGFKGSLNPENPRDYDIVETDSISTILPQENLRHERSLMKLTLAESKAHENGYVITFEKLKGKGVGFEATIDGQGNYATSVTNLEVIYALGYKKDIYNCSFNFIAD